MYRVEGVSGAAEQLAYAVRLFAHLTASCRIQWLSVASVSRSQPLCQSIRSLSNDYRISRIFLLSERRYKQIEPSRDVRHLRAGDYLSHETHLSAGAVIIYQSDICTYRSYLLRLSVGQLLEMQYSWEENNFNSGDDRTWRKADVHVPCLILLRYLV